MVARRSGLVAVEEAPWARWLFASKLAAWIWLVARVWLGYEWLHAAWEKVNTPAGRRAWPGSPSRLLSRKFARGVCRVQMTGA